MIKKIKLGLICMSFALSANVFAVTEHVLRMGTPLDIVLNSNEPQVFPNVFMWTIKGHCTIVSEVEENLLSIKALRKSGTVNGAKITEGQSLQLTVHPNETFYITAEPNAKVEILNTGLIAFKARCMGD